MPCPCRRPRRRPIPGAESDRAESRPASRSRHAPRRAGFRAQRRAGGPRRADRRQAGSVIGMGCGLDRLPHRQPAMGRDGEDGVHPRDRPPRGAGRLGAVAGIGRFQTASPFGGDVFAERQAAPRVAGRHEPPRSHVRRSQPERATFAGVDGRPDTTAARDIQSAGAAEGPASTLTGRGAGDGGWRRHRSATLPSRDILHPSARRVRPTVQRAWRGGLVTERTDGQMRMGGACAAFLEASPGIEPGCKDLQSSA